MSRLLQKYKKDLLPALRNEFAYKNTMQVPRISKVVVAVGTGKLNKDGLYTEKVGKDLALITGQKPATRKAKKSIAGFKLREGSEVGLMVTLRGKRMYDFIDRLVSIALPRSRDFQGLDVKGVDNSGNFSLGFKEQTIFPEVSYESARDIFGLQVTVVTTATKKNEALVLLKSLGFPFQNHSESDSKKSVKSTTK